MLFCPPPSKTDRYPLNLKVNYAANSQPIKLKFFVRCFFVNLNQFSCPLLILKQTCIIEPPYWAMLFIQIGFQI